MSLETQIAALVTAANNLTAAVNGKMGQIDQKVLSAQNTFNANMEELKGRLPRLSVTRNRRMMDNDANGFPDNFGFHAEVSMSKIRTIDARSQATGRTAEDVAFLQQIEADVKEVYPDFDIRAAQHHRAPFTIWQMQWAANASGGGYLAYPEAIDKSTDPNTQLGAVPVNSFITLGAFVKLVDGTFEDTRWVKGAALGKWRWCSSVISPSKSFGNYEYLHPIRRSNSGTIQVALIGACTGVVTHPADWHAMMALGTS